MFGPTEKKSQKVMMLWEKSLHKRIRKFCRDNKCSMSELSRRALRDFMDRFEAGQKEGE